MYYILNPRYALRSWWLVPHAYYTVNKPYAKKLSEEDFEFLKLCDGLHNLPKDERAEELIRRRMIAPCEKGEFTLSEWQRHMDCENRYVPHVMISLTGRCNFNCLHCFNAADNAALQSELPKELLDRLLDEARDCGVHGIILTGGEPMMHPNFREIAEGIHRRGMYLMELVTNGYYIDQELLDFFAGIHCRPIIKLSFDGIGYHDWMRGVKNVEKRTLAAIELCVKNGFTTVVHVNINKKNKDSVLPTLQLLDKMGVQQARVLCTTPVPRWEQNAAGQNMRFGEYYDACIDIAREYVKGAERMELVCWQFFSVSPAAGSYVIDAVKCSSEDAYRATMPRCPRNRGRFGITAAGEVLPCLQMTGWMDSHGISFGNIKEQSLGSFMQFGKLMDLVCTTVGDLAEKNKKCGECRFFKYCSGGCPAFGILYDHFDAEEGLLGTDKAKCFFYENGYYSKITAAMPPEYKNLSENTFLEENC